MIKGRKGAGVIVVTMICETRKNDEKFMTPDPFSFSVLTREVGGCDHPGTEGNQS